MTYTPNSNDRYGLKCKSTTFLANIIFFAKNVTLQHYSTEIAIQSSITNPAQ